MFIWDKLLIRQKSTKFSIKKRTTISVNSYFLKHIFHLKRVVRHVGSFHNTISLKSTRRSYSCTRNWVEWIKKRNEIIELTDWSRVRLTRALNPISCNSAICWRIMKNITSNFIKNNKLLFVFIFTLFL